VEAETGATVISKQRVDEIASSIYTPLCAYRVGESLGSVGIYLNLSGAAEFKRASKPTTPLPKQSKVRVVKPFVAAAAPTPSSTRFMSQSTPSTTPPTLPKSLPASLDGPWLLYEETG